MGHPEIDDQTRFIPDSLRKHMRIRLVIRDGLQPVMLCGEDLLGRHRLGDVGERRQYCFSAGHPGKGVRDRGDVTAYRAFLRRRRLR